MSETSNNDNSAVDQAADIFLQHKGRLLGIAYRMLGNLHEAEEIVQDVYVQWHTRYRTDTVDNPPALLTTLTVRRSLDLMKSAARQREIYPGPWLPTPIVTQWNMSPTDTAAAGQEQASAADDPALQLEMSQTLSTAFMLMLERLSPLERAVFVLRQGFELSYRDIAASIGQNAAYCRQLHTRARRRINQDNKRFDVSSSDQHQVFENFLAALASADIDTVKKFLAEDAISYSDGGGKALAALRPIIGNSKIARLMIGLHKKMAFAVELRFCAINHLPGVIFYHGDKAINAASAVIVDGKINALYMMRNPDKLHHLNKALPL